MGLSPIVHTEITSWAQGMGITLLPFERQAIRAIDLAYIIHCNSKDKNG
jgi:hypothetical protein